MNIHFNKTIRGEDDLSKYLTPKEPYMNEDKKYFNFSYDSAEIINDSLDSIQSCFENAGYKLHRSTSNNFWVSEPEPFSMSFKIQTWDSDFWMSSNNRYEKVGSEPAGFFKNPVIYYQEVPLVKLFGDIYFERLTKVDPISVLKLLDSLGYATKVTTIPIKYYFHHTFSA